MKTFIKNTFKKLITFCVIVVASINFSCSNKEQLCEPIRENDAKDVLTESSNDLETEIFLDPTLSMQGFVTEGSSSFYQQSISMLERAVIKNNGNVRFYKFGGKEKDKEITEILGRNYAEATKKTFYTDPNSQITSIEKVIEKSDPKKLTVVVTDLFQEKADINRLSELLKNKFLVNDLAVGVFAVKSQFNGGIYDVGVNDYDDFKVPPNGEEPVFRPFYLLAFGHYTNITKYFDTLENGEMAAFPEKHRIIFSRYLVNSPVTLAYSKIAETKGLNEVTGVLIKDSGKERSYKEFKVKKQSETAFLAAEIPFNGLPHNLNYEGALTAEIQPVTCQVQTGTSNQSPKPSAIFSPSPSVKTLFDIQTAMLENQQIKFKGVVAPEKLEAGTVYGFRIILRPAKYMLPDWINEWNMTDEQIEVWHKTPTSFDGTKTHNIVPFFQTLGEAVQKVHNPKVADFYCYFRLN